VSRLLSVAFTVVGHEAAWADKGWYPHEPPLSAYDEANQSLDGYRIRTSKPLSNGITRVLTTPPQSVRQTKLSGNASKAAPRRGRAKNIYACFRPKADAHLLKTHRWIAERNNAQDRVLVSSRRIAQRRPSATVMDSHARRRSRRRCLPLHAASYRWSFKSGTA